MKGCRPLEKSEIEQLRGAFRGKMAVRNKALFFLGANTGYRISELLSVRLGDVLTPDGLFPRYLTVKRQNMKGKTESRSVLLNDQAKAALMPWLIALRSMDVIHRDDFLFRSYVDHNKAICREQAWKVFTTCYRKLGFVGKIGTHCMRKTFAGGVHQYFMAAVASGEHVDVLMETSRALNHKNVGTTAAYLSFKDGRTVDAVNSVGI